MDPATYGVWLASGGILSMLALCESGISTVLTQKLAAAWAEGDKERFSIFATTGLFCSVVLGLLFFALGIILSLVVPIAFGLPNDQNEKMQWAVFLAASGSALMLLGYSLGAIPQALQKTVASGMVSIVALICNVAGILIGLACGWGVTALGFGIFCMGLCQVIGLSSVCRFLWRRFGLPYLPTNRIEVIRFAGQAKALFAAKLSSSLGTNLQAPLAAVAVSPEATTVLILTGKMISMVPMLIERFSVAIFAGVAHLSTQTNKERRAVISEIVTISTVFSGLGFGLVFCFNEAIVSLWVGEKMYGGKSLGLLLAATAFISVRQSLVSSLSIALGQIKRTSFWLIAEVVARLIFFAMFVPFLKIFGIPLASSAASMVALFGISFLLTSRCELIARDLWLSGWKGFLGVLVIAAMWGSASPAVEDWTQLLCQGGICSLLMLSASLAVDRGWRNCVLRNLKVIRIGK
jgi:O-antigen/teichoic acid export membrane protein